MVIAAPLLRFTVTGVCAAAVKVALYVIAPPSATLALAASDTVVVSIVSVTVVVAAAGSIASASKLPPDALAIVADTVPESLYTSSPGAGTLTAPLLALAAITMTAPLLSVSLTAVCAVDVSDAV